MCTRRVLRTKRCFRCHGRACKHGCWLESQGCAGLRCVLAHDEVLQAYEAGVAHEEVPARAGEGGFGGE